LADFCLSPRAISDPWRTLGGNLWHLQNHNETNMLHVVKRAIRDYIAATGALISCNKPVLFISRSVITLRSLIDNGY
jgi:hypothetical protein